MIQGLNLFARAALHSAVEHHERMTPAVRAGLSGALRLLATSRGHRSLRQRHPAAPGPSQLCHACANRGRAGPVPPLPGVLDLGDARLVLRAGVSRTLPGILPRRPRSIAWPTPGITWSRTPTSGSCRWSRIFSPATPSPRKRPRRSRETMESYRVRIADENLTFSAAHFITLEGQRLRIAPRPQLSRGGRDRRPAERKPLCRRFSGRRRRAAGDPRGVGPRRAPAHRASAAASHGRDRGGRGPLGPAPLGLSAVRLPLVAAGQHDGRVAGRSTSGSGCSMPCSRRGATRPETVRIEVEESPGHSAIWELRNPSGQSLASGCPLPGRGVRVRGIDACRRCRRFDVFSIAAHPDPLPEGEGNFSRDAGQFRQSLLAGTSKSSPRPRSGELKQHAFSCR